MPINEEEFEKLDKTPSRGFGLKGKSLRGTVLAAMTTKGGYSAAELVKPVSEVLKTEVKIASVQTALNNLFRDDKLDRGYLVDKEGKRTSVFKNLAKSA